MNKIKNWFGYSNELEEVITNTEKTFVKGYSNNPEYYLFKLERKDLNSHDLYVTKNIFNLELNHILQTEVKVMYCSFDDDYIYLYFKRPDREIIKSEVNLLFNRCKDFLYKHRNVVNGYAHFPLIDSFNCSQKLEIWFKFKDLPDFKGRYKIVRRETLRKLNNVLIDILNDKGFYANHDTENTKMYYGGIELTCDVEGVKVASLIIPNYKYGFNYCIEDFREFFKDILNRHVCDDYFIPVVKRKEPIDEDINLEQMPE